MLLECRSEIPASGSDEPLAYFPFTWDGMLVVQGFLMICNVFCRHWKSTLAFPIMHITTS